METDMEETQDTPRTAKEIAKRAIIISTIVACAYGDSKADNIRWLKQEGLWDEVSPEVVHERHYAINWIIGDIGQEWDDISTDT
jgi:hypothetical protein